MSDACTLILLSISQLWRVGTVYAERRPATAPREDSLTSEPATLFSSQAAPQVAQAVQPATQQSASPWGVYKGAAAVDSLVEYLNVQGRREAALKKVHLLSFWRLPQHSLKVLTGCTWRLLIAQAPGLS